MEKTPISDPKADMEEVCRVFGLSPKIRQEMIAAFQGREKHIKNAMYDMLNRAASYGNPEIVGIYRENGGVRTEWNCQGMPIETRYEFPKSD